jgi:hypothetical protein
MKKPVKFILGLVILILVSVLISLYSNNPRTIIRRLLLSEQPVVGLLQYKIKLFGVLGLGGAKIVYPPPKDSSLSQTYNIRAEGEASKFISLFFKPKVTAESQIDLKQSLPVKFNYILDIPGLPLEDKAITYDHQNKTMDLDGEKRVIFENTQDPLSVMYFIQNQEMAIGKIFDINVNTNQKNYRFLLKAAKKTEHIIKGKKVTIWMLEGDIRRRDKSRRHKTTIKIWFWEERKVAVLVKTMTNGGQFVITLSGMEKQL